MDMARQEDKKGKKVGRKCFSIILSLRSVELDDFLIFSFFKIAVKTSAKMDSKKAG
jgi:hypothetical protein